MVYPLKWLMDITATTFQTRITTKPSTLLIRWRLSAGSDVNMYQYSLKVAWSVPVHNVLHKCCPIRQSQYRVRWLSLYKVTWLGWLTKNIPRPLLDATGFTIQAPRVKKYNFKGTDRLCKVVKLSMQWTNNDDEK